ncbi:MAG: hypothetical protein QXW71_02440 [Thermoplasmata archaeon]
MKNKIEKNKIENIIKELYNLQNVLDCLEEERKEYLNMLIKQWSNIVDCLFSDRCYINVYSKQDKFEIYFHAPYTITIDIDINTGLKDLTNLVKSKIIETFDLQVRETARILADVVKNIKLTK